MPPSRVQRAALSERACLQCQKRKTRCVPQDVGQPCEYCDKSQRECVFSARPSKTALTRRNLDDAEARCQELEAQLQRCSGASVGSRSVAPASSLCPSEARHENAVRPGIQHVATDPGRESVAGGSPYEWDETLVSEEPRTGLKPMQDGMVSLGASKVGTVYLGMTSGHAILETISSALSPHASSDLRQSRQNENMGSTPGEKAGHRLSQLLTISHVQDQFVSAYFECYNKSFPILHERTFKVQYAKRNQLARDESWQMLFYMVLAVGEWVGGFSDGHNSIYYDAARSRFKPESLESGNLTTVQAFLLMSNYLQKRDRPNTAFNLLGIAHRMAVGLGLHREPNPTGGTETLSSLRRRMVFWVLYCFDSGFSITTGRPNFMDDSFIDVSIPRNVDDSNCQHPEDQPSAVAYPTSVSAIIAQARLAKMANKAYRQFSSISPCADPDHQTSVMEHMLGTWRTSLPGYFFSDDVPLWFIRCRKVVLWKEANVRILLLLASQRQRTDLHEKVTVGQRYQSAAADTLMDICAFYKEPQIPAGPGLSWYAVYFMLQAALALSVHELAKSNLESLPCGQESEAYTYDQLMDQARECLKGLAQYDFNGVRALRGLAQLQKGVAQSRAEANIPLPQNDHNPSSSTGGVDVTNVNPRKSTDFYQFRDMTNLQTPPETMNPSITYPYGYDGYGMPGINNIMETSFPAYDNEEFLAGVFQDCYGPFHFGQDT